MNKRIYLSAPHMGDQELNFVKEAFDTNWVAPAGPHINAFESGLERYLGGTYVAALSSGTAAIHLALILLNVKEGDEVICSSFTFSGSCNPIVYQKATPVFVDSEPETWNMDPDLLQEAIEDRLRKGKKPKAIILVHLYGMPAKIDEISKIASAYDIPVIEDAAEALGASYNDAKCGTLGDFGILSFNGNKIITTSGGGALTCRRSDHIEKAKFLATQARDPAPHYQHSEIGYNYRLSNICAGIGRGQLEVLDLRVEQRRRVFSWYTENLADIIDRFQTEQKGSFSNRWLTAVTFKDRTIGLHEKVRVALERDNIETRPLWKPMHLQPIFKDCRVYGGKVSEDLFNNGLCLPSSSALTEVELQRVKKSINTFFSNN